MTPPRLILASGSPQRRNLLDETGYRFEVVVPDASVEEECGICSTSGPAALVTELALRKAANIATKMAERNEAQLATVIVACDTVAECAGAVLGKPRDQDHARRMLHQLRGQDQRVLSGLCLWALGMGENYQAPLTLLAVTELRMDPINDDDLEDYLDSGLWRGKAGAFGYQDRHGWLHVLKGSESNVVGLPMEILSKHLDEFQIFPDN